MRTVEARIEIPMGSQNKYEIDEVTGKIKLDRVLYSASFYPAEYGFFENTLSFDGDPLDVLVFTSAATFPGCYINCRIIGGLDMIDAGLEDTKIIAVNNGDPRYDNVNCLEDLAPHYLKEIENFFATYKVLQNLKTEVLGFFDAKKAEEYLDEALQRYEDEQKKINNK